MFFQIIYRSHVYCFNVSESLNLILAICFLGWSEGARVEKLIGPTLGASKLICHMEEFRCAMPQDGILAMPDGNSNFVGHSNKNWMKYGMP